MNQVDKHSNTSNAYSISVLLLFALLFLVNHGLIASEQRNKILHKINIELTTHLGDKQIYIDRDTISFFISIDKPAYLYAFYQDASGSIYQLMPGLAQTDHFFSAGFYIPFPANDSPFKLQVQAPFGKETFYIYASDQKHISFNSYADKESLVQIQGSVLDIERTVKQSSKTFYGHSALTVKTQKNIKP